MRRTLRRVAIGAAVLIGLGAAGLVCQRVSDRGRYATEHSTYGSGPEGTRALYLVAEAMGAQPRRWAEELARLPERGMLVALGSCDQLLRREVDRIERENLRAWVERGGVLVVAGVPDYVSREDFGAALVGDEEQCRPRHGLLGMLARAERRAQQGDAAPERPDGGPTELEDLPQALQEDPVGTYEEVTAQDELGEARLAVATAAPLEGLGPVGVRRPLRIELDEGTEAETLLRLDDSAGPPVGVRIPVGQGAVVLLASASPFTNRDLVDGGGAVLFARLVRAHASEGPVIFDEYHLGVGQRRSTMRYLRQAGATGLVVQVLLLAGFALWRLGARFGGLRADAPVEPGGTASYVDGVARLYEKAGDPSGAGHIVVRRALARIAKHHHLPSSDPARLIDAFERRGQRRAKEAVEALRAMLSDEKPSRGLTKLTAEVDRLVAAATSESAALDTTRTAR
jgi:hypothetical protein